ncbi:MAG: Hpt domain-containing protein [Caulobacteraceae bacterium]
MARRDIKGAVDFAYLEGFAAGDETLIEEVLEIFGEQAAMWARLLDDAGGPAGAWRDAVHTIKGAARGVGAFRLGEACEACEASGPGAISRVRAELDAALSDIAAYRHERAIASLRRG